MKRIFFIISLLLVSWYTQAATPDSLYSAANKLYQTGQFEQASGLYTQILQAGYKTPEVYFNLGNSCFKAHQIARAVLNYERAYRLAPGDGEIKYNLELARSYVVDKIEGIPVFFLSRWWHGMFSSNTWFWISLVTFIAVLLFLLGYLLTSRLWLKKSLFFISVFILVVSVLSFINCYKQKERFTNTRDAIIMISPVNVKSAPDHGSTDLFVLHEGTKVEVEDEVGDWVEIRIADGNKGWTEKSTIERI